MLQRVRVDTNGKIVRRAKVASEPEALIGWFGSLKFDLARIGLRLGRSRSGSTRR